MNRIDSIKDEKEAVKFGWDKDQILAMASEENQSVPQSVDGKEKNRLSKDHNRSNLTAVKVIKQGNSAIKPNTAVNDFRDKSRGELSTSPKISTKHAAGASYEQARSKNPDEKTQTNESKKFNANFNASQPSAGSRIVSVKR